MPGRPLPIYLVCLLAAGLVVACLSPAAVAQVAPSPSPLPTDTPTVSPTATLSPTPTASPTFTASPTATASPTSTFTASPTRVPTATPDAYADAYLRVSDLPRGFAALTAADRTQMHLTDGELQMGLANSFKLADLHNFSGFAYGGLSTSQVIVAYLVYPLTPAEQSSMDVVLSDPSIFAKFMAAGLTQRSQGSGVTSRVSPLAGMNKFGDMSAGITISLAGSDGTKVRMDLVAVRLAEVLEFCNTYYRDGVHPAAAIGDIARLLDTRVAAAVH